MSNKQIHKSYNSGKKKRANRRRLQVLIFLGSVVLVASLLTIALVVGNEPPIIPPSTISSTPPPSSSSLSSSSSIAVSSTSQSTAAPVPQGPYHEQAMPALFNSTNIIPEEYFTSLTLVDVGLDELRGARVEMETRAGEAFMAMQAAADAEGVHFFPYSGHRSHNRQSTNYNASIQRYLGQGLSQADAERKTKDYYAVPGTSEHEAGLAIDINGIQESFENTDAFAWLQENAATYGFILRYPKDDAAYALTNVRYEPWHYRYVGENHAKIIWDEKLTLEEYYTKSTQNP